MRCYVVTEGPTEVLLLKRVLASMGVSNAEVVGGGGKSSVTSMAQSLLVSRNRPVAVVMDADMVDRQRVREQERIYFDLLKSYASGTAFRILLVVPEIESVFFVEPRVLESELSWHIPKEQLLDAETRPKEVLLRALRSHGMENCLDFVRQLSEPSLELLGQTPLFRELSAFLSEPTGTGTWSSELSHLAKQ